MNKLKYIISTLIGILIVSGVVYAATLPVFSGGTGAVTLTGCLTGNGTSAITGTGSPCGSGGSGLSTTTADYIIYPTSGTAAASTTNALKTSTNSVISSSGSFDVVMRAVIGNATSTLPYRTNIYISPGKYFAQSTSTFGGGTSANPDVNDTPMWKIWGAGAGGTVIVVNKNTTGFNFSDFSKADISGLTFYLQTGSTAIGARSANTGIRSLWNSSIANLFIVSTSTGDTGKGLDLQNTFRNTYNNIQFLALSACIMEKAQGSAFFIGDSVFENMMCDFSSVAGSGVAYELIAPAGGQVNQDTWIDTNGFSDTGTHTHFKLTNTDWTTARGINSEGFATTTDIISGTGNHFDYNYITLKSGTGTNYFGTSVTAFNNSFGCTFVDNPTGTHQLLVDANTITSQPNVVQGVNGANCVMQGAGTFIFTTTTASIVRDIADNIGSITYLSAMKIAANKLYFDFSSTLNTFVQFIGGALRFNVGGTDALDISSSGFGTTTVIGLNINAQATSTSNVGFNITTGCYAIAGTCVSGGTSGGGGSPGGTGTELQYRGGASTFSAVTNSAFNATANTLSIGTTTSALAMVTLSTSTAPQLIITDNNNTNAWAFRDTANTFYLASTSPTTFATSTVPALTINSNGNVGIYNSAPAGILDVQSKLIVLANGNVGIGTAVPTQEFQVEGGSAGVNIVRTASDAFLRLSTAHTGGLSSQIRIDATKGDLYFTTNDSVSERMRITTPGNVGIGTSTPFGMLNIASTTVSATFKPQLTLTDSSGGINAKHFTFSVEGGNFYIATATDLLATTSSASILSIIGSSGSVGISSTTPFGQFSVNSQAGTPSLVIGSSTGTYLIVDKFGKVGVGTTTATVGAGLEISTNATTTSPGLLIDGSWYTTGNATSNKPQLLIEPTGTVSNNWSTAGTGLGVNAVSGFTGNLIVAQVAGGNKFTVSSTGSIGANSLFRNAGSANDSVVTPTTFGTYISRTNTGAGVALIAQQVNATQTGDIAEFLNSLGTTTVFTARGSEGIGTSTPYGLLNISTSSANTGGFVPQLVLSDQSATTNQKHWFFASQGGNLYVGTSTDTLATTSTAALSITGSGPAVLNVGASSTPSATVSITNVAGTDNLAIGSSTGYTFLVNSTGRVFFGTYADCNGATNALGVTNKQVSCDSGVSDERLKKDFNPITPEDALHKVLSLKPTTFYYLDNNVPGFDTQSKSLQSGFKAQDVQKIIPSLVEKKQPTKYSPDGTLVLDYSQFAPYFAGSIQGLQDEIDNLKIGVVTTKRSAEENWQWIVMGLLILWNLGLTFRKKK